jgi:hypothetical protein
MLAFAVAAGCRGEGEHCRAPSASEQVYPFTGVATLANAGDALRICLYQVDAQNVRGSAGNQDIYGIITADGVLLLPVRSRSTIEIVQLSLRDNRLQVVTGGRRGVPLNVRVLHWERRSPATFNPAASGS